MPQKFRHARLRGLAVVTALLALATTSLLWAARLPIASTASA